MSLLPGSRFPIMLPVTGRPSPVLSIVGGPIRSLSDASTYTYTNVTLGDPHEKRLIIIPMGFRASVSTPRTVTGVTIDTGGGPVPMNIVGMPASATPAAIAWLVVPTGTTATVVVTMSGTALRMNGHVLALGGYESATPLSSSNAFYDGTAVPIEIETVTNQPAGSLAVSILTKTGVTAPFDLVEGGTVIQSTGGLESMRTLIVTRASQFDTFGHKTRARIALDTNAPLSAITAVWR